MLFDLEMYLDRLNMSFKLRNIFKVRQRRKILKNIATVCDNREVVIVDALVDYLCKKEYCLLANGSCGGNCKECQRNELNNVVNSYIENNYMC